MTTNTLEATIRFLTTSEGGRSRPAVTGIRPHLKLGGIFTSCIIRAHGRTETFELGENYNVTIEIPFWDEYSSFFCVNVPIELFDGNRLIARGFWQRSTC